MYVLILYPSQSTLDLAKYVMSLGLSSPLYNIDDATVLREGSLRGCLSVQLSGQKQTELDRFTVLREYSNRFMLFDDFLRKLGTPRQTDFCISKQNYGRPNRNSDPPE